MEKFELGNIHFTKGVYDFTKEDIAFANFVILSLGKYRRCDWGDTCKEDAKLNDEAVANSNERILAVYIYQKTKKKIWIITEWDRSTTTVLFPEEY